VRSKSTESPLIPTSRRQLFLPVSVSELIEWFTDFRRLNHDAPLRFESSGLSTEERLSMKRLISFSLAFVITICMIVGSERRAWGYVDPGSGLIALQGIASVAAAYVYMIRRRILAFFSRKKENAAVVLPVANKTGESREIA
jgi:hypothetical protein